MVDGGPRTTTRPEVRLGTPRAGQGADGAPPPPNGPCNRRVWWGRYVRRNVKPLLRSFRRKKISIKF